MKKIFTIIFMFLVMATNAQTKYEMNTIDVINQIRQNPKSAIKYIDSLKANIPNYVTSVNGSYVKDNKKIIDLITKYNETIDFLNNQKPVDTLTFSKEIYNEVSKFEFKFLHLIAQGKHTTLGYTENIGGVNNPYDDVIQLIIDGNTEPKGHRKTIFGEFTEVSVKVFKYNGIEYSVQNFQ